MPLNKHNGDFTWKNVPMLDYKEEGTHFRAVTRQILFDGTKNLHGQLRYFEIASGGYSTLERHTHEHVVMIIRGKGKALVGQEVLLLDSFDVVYIPPNTWHQFQAIEQKPFGFLCIVNVERDRPERPDRAALDEIRKNDVAARFIKI